VWWKGNQGAQEMNRNILRNELEILMRKAQNLPDVEMRFIPFQDLQLRAEVDQDPTKPYQFTGYAVKWDSINSHREKFVKGAFADFINAVKAGAQKCHLYYNHGWSLLWVNPKFAMRIGKWIELEEDEIGLKVTGELTPRMSLAQDVQAMIEHETVDGLSVAFYQPAEMDVEYQSDDDYVLIKRVGLYEISVCDEPSDRNARLTDADIRNIETEDDLKQFLKRFNLDDDASNQLIQRVKSFGQPDDPAQNTKSKDPLAWITV
jgi:HK97 family phage prohead protease